MLLLSSHGVCFQKGGGNESFLLLHVRPGFLYLRTWYSVLRGEHLDFQSIQLERTCRQLSTCKFTSFAIPTTIRDLKGREKGGFSKKLCQKSQMIKKQKRQNC